MNGSDGCKYGHLKCRAIMLQSILFPTYLSSLIYCTCWKFYTLIISICGSQSCCVIACLWTYYSFCPPSMKYPLSFHYLQLLELHLLHLPISVLVCVRYPLLWAPTIPGVLKFFIYISSLSIRLKVPEEGYWVVSMSVALTPSQVLL